MESEVAQINLKIVSYNMHGFMPGFSVLEDFVNSEESPDVFSPTVHWLTPDNLSKFD